MPYSTPSVGRAGHRRSVDIPPNGGAFGSIGSLPRRTMPSKPVFHFRNDDDDGDDSSNDEDNVPPPPLKLNPNNSLRISLNPIPFPTSSAPLSPARPSPSRTNSTPILLSNGKPLKSSLKSSSSSPNIPSEALRPIHLRARSAPSTPSADILPPKNVHFPSSNLETIRVFNRSAKPASLSRPAGDPETETETETETAGNGGFALEGFIPGPMNTSFPFPRLPTTPSSPLNPNNTPSYDLDLDGYPVPSPSPALSAHVYLESIHLTPGKGPVLAGTLLVRNIAFEKQVFLRFTLDEWQTTSEVSAKYVTSLSTLPPAFLPRTLGDILAVVSSATYDRFAFTIRLEDYQSHLESKTIWAVARFTAPGVGEWWDNNQQRNYRVKFKRQAPKSIAAPQVKERSLSEPTRPTSAAAATPPVKTPSPSHSAAVSAATSQRLSKFSLSNYAKPAAVPSTPISPVSPTSPRPPVPDVKIVEPTPTKPDTFTTPPAPPVKGDEEEMLSPLSALPLTTPPSPKPSNLSSYGGVYWPWGSSAATPSPQGKAKPSDAEVVLESAVKDPSPPPQSMMYTPGMFRNRNNAGNKLVVPQRKPIRRSPPPPPSAPSSTSRPALTPLHTTPLTSSSSPTEGYHECLPSLERSSSTSSSDSLSSLDEDAYAYRTPYLHSGSRPITIPRVQSPTPLPMGMPIGGLPTVLGDGPAKVLQTLQRSRSASPQEPTGPSAASGGPPHPDTENEKNGNGEGVVDADSLYQAFVRQWCFAGTGAPVGAQDGIQA